MLPWQLGRRGHSKFWRAIKACCALSKTVNGPLIYEAGNTHHRWIHCRYLQLLMASRALFITESTQIARSLKLECRQILHSMPVLFRVFDINYAIVFHQGTYLSSRMWVEFSPLFDSEYPPVTWHECITKCVWSFEFLTHSCLDVATESCLGNICFKSIWWS